MEKAYDPKDLVGRLKKRGLNVGEDAAKGVVEDVFGWAEESAKLSESPFDDLAAAAYPTLKKAAIEAIDKVDGEVG